MISDKVRVSGEKGLSERAESIRLAGHECVLCVCVTSQCLVDTSQRDGSETLQLSCIADECVCVYS